MKPLIINVRGNSGSGKTHLAREFMALCTPPESWINEGEPDQSLVYKGQFWVVLGKYHNACGGADGIHMQAEIVRRIKFYNKEGANVFVEGLLMSGMYGTVGKFSERFGDRWVFAFLNTPLELCLRRVQLRRDAAGNEKPFNPANTERRHDVIARTRLRIHDMGRRVVDLDYKDPLEQLLKIIRKEG